MDVHSKTAVVTGAAGGIGSAIARALTQRGARVMLADLDPRVQEIAAELGQRAWSGDCTSTQGIAELIEATRAELGEVDLYFANAGIIGPQDLGEDESDWDLIIDVNLRAHIRAAKALVPGWADGRGGHFVATASAAGLLTQIGQAGYSVTKHAAVGFAEWLSITYGDRGVGVTCLCPMGVNTAMLHGADNTEDSLDAAAQSAVTSAGRVLEPDEVATCVLAAVESGTFLALPHPEVLEMYRMKGSDYDRWLRGMRRYQSKLLAGTR
ncbi:SDR family oxidoreductase [Brevibacterium sp. 50QC2O2]|uniref:SDR family oxidoreductase n=1 Tax=Brevibacterium TaxID=1696 RepID=UPI00211BD9ED|nr:MULTISPECIES: SDR family oxidoreductase [unclassified Brevibacterium]MCQ9384215.1 SDR family oxidoreductase [Brevibacterium sp. 68QC2CO]MCQ9388306.1 SDR family oxidoreductase [Brevibacterium sp. 50QC2O2]